MLALLQACGPCCIVCCRKRGMVFISVLWFVHLLIGYQLLVGKKPTIVDCFQISTFSCHEVVKKGLLFSLEAESLFVSVALQCSRSCHGGTRTRSVYCFTANNQRTYDHHCDVTKRPTRIDACNLKSCPPDHRWRKSAWSSVRWGIVDADRPKSFVVIHGVRLFLPKAAFDVEHDTNTNK